MKSWRSSSTSTTSLSFMELWKEEFLVVFINDTSKPFIINIACENIGHYFSVVNSGSFARFRLINCFAIQINCFVFDILRFDSKPNSGTIKIMRIF